MRIGTSNNIKELVPIFMDGFTDENVPELVYKIHEEKIELYRNRIGIAGNYFFGHLHDSDILSMKKTKGKDLQLRVNDYATQAFACALVDKKNIALEKTALKFPLEITSSGTEHLSLNTVGIDGWIHPCRFRQMDEYLYEEIISWEEGHIEIAFNLWVNRSPRDNRFLLLLSCRHLNILEYQETSWKKYFGNTYNNYYEYFKKERSKGRFLSDYELCKKLIDEIEK